MFGRSALTSASAAASLAAILLAATGCKVQVGSAAQASPAGPAGSPGVTRAGSLVVEPGAGFSPVYKLINGARRSIDVTMYEFSDTTAEHDLAAAAQRGVRVHVILDQREQSENAAEYS
jgi:phosphatidylserine/phosphatidylglycerophosphate/cardiolipin synthase-like enzyme